MPSPIFKSFFRNDNKFSSNFKVDSYENSTISVPILNIWFDITVALRQEEKQNTYLYLYHEVKASDTLENISQFYYNDIGYWWLPLVVNDAQEPFDFLRDHMNNESPIKILKEGYLKTIINSNVSFDIVDYLKGKNNGG
jgi:3'-phosphoadenosine 5'-phosphosulfate sulfotransferase (PAPS reductase)/FAD synthetase